MKKLSREEAAKILEGMKVKIKIPKAAVTQWERNAALDMAIEVLNCSEIPNKSDTISRQAALDAIMGQPPEPHYPSWYAAQIAELPAVQPATNCSEIPNGSDDTISRRAVIDAMKDMYRAAEKWLRDATDDVTKARAESCMASLVEIKLRTEKLPSVQPDHVANTGKKVADDDCISRKAAIDAVSEYATFWMSYTDDMSASDIAQEAINSAKDTMIRILKNQPSAQPETATVTIARTKGGVTMWYECDACGEPIDQKDCYCRNCGRKLKYE